MLGADFKAEDCCRIWARDLRSGLQRRYAFVHFSSEEHAEEFTKKIVAKYAAEGRKMDFVPAICQGISANLHQMRPTSQRGNARNATAAADPDSVYVTGSARARSFFFS